VEALFTLAEPFLRVLALGDVVGDPKDAKDIAVRASERRLAR